MIPWLLPKGKGCLYAREATQKKTAKKHKLPHLTKVYKSRAIIRRKEIAFLKLQKKRQSTFYLEQKGKKTLRTGKQRGNMLDLQATLR